MNRLAETVQSSRAQLERARRLLLPTRRTPDAFSEHREIYEALTRRDGDAAAAAMRRHLDVGLSEIKSFAAERPELFEP